MAVPNPALLWRKTNAPVSSSRTDDIWFASPETGWAVNSNGQILKTGDGGNSWTVQHFEIFGRIWSYPVIYIAETLDGLAKNGETGNAAVEAKVKAGARELTQRSGVPMSRG